MIKFREHRGTLEDALKTLVEVEDMAALDRHIRQVYPGLTDGIEVALYTDWPDDRIPGWERTYIVQTQSGGIPLGFCSIPLRREYRM